MKPVNIGGEGEIPNVINLQGRWALRHEYGRSDDSPFLPNGTSVAGMIRKGVQFLIFNAYAEGLPFRTGTVPKVITNSVNVGKSMGVYPKIPREEIIRVLKPGGTWVRDGKVFYTKPGG